MLLLTGPIVFKPALIAYESIKVFGSAVETEKKMG